MLQKIMLGGGCFWGVEAALQTLKGIINTEVGYAGGTTKGPSYQQVCTGTTGHAEVVLVEFEDSQLRLDQLLDFFMGIHDPTSLNKQGNDIGTQYRSCIYFQNQPQFDQAKIYLEGLKSKLNLRRPMTTELKVLTEFWPAEDYHQDYLKKNPNGYCHISLDNLPKIKD